MRRVKLIPTAESGPPDVTIGDLVQCRDAGGRWLTMLALAPPRYDIASAFGRTCWMSVPVVDLDDWDAGRRRGARWCNWPADAVPPTPSTAPATCTGGRRR